MNRRSFFGFFGGAAPAADVALTSSGQQAATIPDAGQFQGWTVRWTGWKESINNVHLGGQWVAQRLNEKGLLDRNYFGVFLSIPGGCGPHLPGEEINLFSRFPQPIIQVITPEGLREAWRLVTLRIFIDLLQAHDWKFKRVSHLGEYRYLMLDEAFRNLRRPQSKMWINASEYFKEAGLSQDEIAREWYSPTGVVWQEARRLFGDILIL